MKKLFIVLLTALLGFSVQAQDIIKLKSYEGITSVQKSFTIFQVLEADEAPNGEEYAMALAIDNSNETTVCLFFLGDNIVYDDMRVNTYAGFNSHLWGIYNYTTKYNRNVTVPVYLITSKKTILSKAKIDAWKALLESVYDGQ